jgi:hypothetical protein
LRVKRYNAFNELLSAQFIHNYDDACGLNMQKAWGTQRKRLLNYAAAADFYSIYNEEAYSLLSLSILLTANMLKAEECFIRGLEQSLGETHVFLDQVRRWARRDIIKQAIQLINPGNRQAREECSSSVEFPENAEMSNLVAAIVTLHPFERFVFVMTVIERQSDQDCALLLKCSRRDIVAARALALTKLPASKDNAIPDEVAFDARRAISQTPAIESGC